VTHPPRTPKTRTYNQALCRTGTKPFQFFYSQFTEHSIRSQKETLCVRRQHRKLLARPLPPEAPERRRQSSRLPNAPTSAGVYENKNLCTNMCGSWLLVFPAHVSHLSLCATPQGVSGGRTTQPVSIPVYLYIHRTVRRIKQKVTPPACASSPVAAHTCSK